MRTLLACLMLPSFFLTTSIAFSASTLLDCEKAHRERRIQACSTIIETEKVAGKAASQHLLALAYHHRGNAHRDKRLYDQAIEDYDMAIALNPAITLAYYHKANIQRNRGQLERAIGNYDQVIARHSKHPEAYFGRGEAYYYQGQATRAAEDYATALKLDPSLMHAWTALRRLGVQP